MNDYNSFQIMFLSVSEIKNLNYEMLLTKKINVKKN